MSDDTKQTGTDNIQFTGGPSDQPTDKNSQRAAEAPVDPLEVEMPYGATEEGGELDRDGSLDSDSDFQMPEGFPEMDENMMAQVQEMMGQLQKGQRAEELEKENADLKARLGRLAADFDGYRARTAAETADAQSKGMSKAAEALMPVYDDISRALSMGAEDPAKLIPGMQAVQSKVLSVFAGLGLEPSGKEGEAFDPTYHEAIQVVAGEDGTIVQTYELGFRMGERCVRPARVAVGQKG